MGDYFMSPNPHDPGMWGWHGFRGHRGVLGTHGPSSHRAPSDSLSFPVPCWFSLVPTRTRHPRWSCLLFSAFNKYFLTPRRAAFQPWPLRTGVRNPAARLGYLSSRDPPSDFRLLLGAAGWGWVFTGQPLTAALTLACTVTQGEKHTTSPYFGCIWNDLPSQCIYYYL